MRVVAILVGLVALGLAPGAGSAERAGAIVFVAGNGDIRLVDPETKSVRVVTTAFRTSVFAAPTDEPQLSPDGSLIAFASGRGVRPGASAIWVIRPDGSGATRLTEDVSAYEVSPAWSADGSRLLFSRGPRPEDLAYRPPPYSGLWSMRADGSERTKLVDSAEQFSVYGRSLGVSPDGRRLVYTINADRFGYLPVVVVADADGDNARPIAGGVSPAWSPDGQRIVFLFPNGETLPTGLPRYDVVVMAPDGGSFRRLPRPLAGWSPIHVRWAPAGERLVVSSLADGAGQSRLYLLNADGTGLVDLGVEGVRPDWGPAIAPRRCRVPALRGRTLAEARRALRLFDCRVGKVTGRSGRVVSQRPAAGRVLRRGAKVALVLGRR